MPRENLRIADLHTHSTVSDGVLSPAELVRLAASCKVEVLALTDHDSAEGCAEAGAEAAVNAIDFINGIELSTFHRDGEYHLLGYFIDTDNGDIVRYQRQMGTARRERIEEILSRLMGMGLSVTLGTIAQGVPTRSHVARAIVASGYANDVGQAFRDYLSVGAPAYIPAATIDIRSAIDLVHAAGGLASLAHPGDWTSESDIRTFVGWGLDAIEVIHPSHDTRLRDYYASLAARLGILKTGGSDFHGPSESPASAMGGHMIERSWYQALRVAGK